MISREYFESITDDLLNQLKGGEHLFLNLYSEKSQFIRLNSAKIRQIGTVEDAILELTLICEDGSHNLRKASGSDSLRGVLDVDRKVWSSVLSQLRDEVRRLPADPYAQLPRDTGSSTFEKKGKLLPVSDAPEALNSALEGMDVAGIYASGAIIRGAANSAGQRHWFATETFSFDYSVYTKAQRALKGTFAGQVWDQERYRSEMQSARSRVAVLERPSKRIARGGYRTYLAPAALNEVIGMLSWGAIGEAAIRQGDSPLRLMRSGEKKLSPRFELAEDFRSGEVPRFNAEGEIAPECLPLVKNGELVSALVSSRSAKEYGVQSNGAAQGEGLRAPSVAEGGLSEGEILKKLDTGLYLSNLHYLNWSDQAGGRITGMTRYACFWVEKGEIIAPIENMRFDDSIFHLLGSELIDLTSRRVFMPEIHTYSMRSLGGTWLPGALIGKMEFTL